MSTVEKPPVDHLIQPLPYAQEMLAGLAVGAAVFGVVIKTEIGHTDQALQDNGDKIWSRQESLNDLRAAEKVVKKVDINSPTIPLIENKISQQRQGITELRAEKKQIGNEAINTTEMLGIPLVATICTAAFFIKRNRRQVREYRPR